MIDPELARIKVSRRARRLSLRIDPFERKAIVTRPLGISDAQARNFVTAHQDWVEKTLEKAREAA